MKNKRQLLSILSIISLLVVMVSSGVAAATPASFVGEWSGAIDIPGQKLDINVRLFWEEGAFTGEMDIPLQGAVGIPLKDFLVEESTISFVLSGIPGDPGVVASLAEDGTEMVGQFKQAGMEFPVSLGRQAVKEATATEPKRTVEEIQGDLRSFIDEMLEEWDVPGAAVGVVYRGKTVLADGFGLRDVERELPVTRDTLFAIGSSTKAFTAASVAIMVDEGKLAWDTPANEYLPWFRLYSNEATLNATLRDLATHRTGLARHDFAWYGANQTREEFIRESRYLEPSVGLREQFQYNNYMYTTLGYIAGQAAGMEWEQLVQRRFLDVLGMQDTNFSVREMEKHANHALPYIKTGGQVNDTPFRQIDGMGPAGNINSTVSDMLKWVDLFLNGGKLGEQQLLSNMSIREMTSAQIALPVGGYPEVRFSNYGLGWIVEDYRGNTFVQHGGNIDGFSALVAMIPAEQLGIVVLTNMNNSPLPALIAYHAVDQLLGLEPIDWSGRFKPGYDMMPEEALRPPRKTEGTNPSRGLEEYVGHYEHPAYGLVVITLDNDGGLFFNFGDITTPLEHWHYDVFAARITGFSAGLNIPVHFRSGIDGHIHSLEIPWEPVLSPIVFKVTADPSLMDAANLARFVGTYEVMGMHLMISVRDTILIMEIPGQGAIELTPERGLRFQVKDMPGGSVDFVENENSIIGLFLNQPNGTFEAKRVE